MRKAIILFCIVAIMTSCGPRSTIHPAGGNAESRTQNVEFPHRKSNGSRCAIPMRRENGVCYVTVKINGVDMEVIFDTGASDVVISSIEALFLFKQGKLAEDDIIGTSCYQVADGDIAIGTVIRLRTVQIGSKTLTDVRATVVDNMGAPLLLGQSALDRFSSVSIDYNRSVIYIE